MSSEFSYFGEHGTANWATLFEDYCAGSKQSPIDIDTSALVTKDFDPLVLKGYKRKEPGYWANNGHSVQFTLDDPGKQMVSGQTFALFNFYCNKTAIINNLLANIDIVIAIILSGICLFQVDP